MKSSNIGGQAVLEGIMMKNKEDYAVAVRKPDGEIEVGVYKYKSEVPLKTVYKIPFIRGVFSFIDSLVLGMKSLNFSASFIEDEEENKENKKLTKEEQIRKDKKDKTLMSITMVFSVILAIGLFMVLPYLLSSLLKGVVSSRTTLTVIEGIFRFLIFITYILLVSRLEDIQRTFMYHGAEHKCINCIEHGMELNVENVQKSSKQHKRCGTSFLFFVMLVSLFFCFFITTSSPILRVVIRIALFPVIAGVSYEIIKLAGNSDNKFVNLLSKPGLMVQNLTTKEPTDDMVEVAIKAVEAVFDWKTYLKENFDYDYNEDK